MAYISTAPVPVNQVTAGFQIATDLLVTPAGGFEVDWSTEGSVPTSAAFYTPSQRLFDADGIPLSDQADGPVVTGAFSAPVHLHDTIQLDDGTVLKALQVRTTSPATTLVLQLFDQNGVALGNPIFSVFIGLGGTAGLLQLPDHDIVLVEQELTKTGPADIFETVLHNTAGQPPDTVAPVVTNLFPAPGSSTLPPDWNIGITFSEPVKAARGVITLETGDGQVVQTIAAFNGAIQYLGPRMIINPTADLQPGTTYKLVIAPDAVTDLSGNAYAGESDYTFTTAGGAPAPGGDTTAPTAVDFFPAAGSSTLPPDWNLGITFSEAVKAGAGTITLQTGTGQVVQTFNAASDPGIQFVGSSVVINPAADLEAGTTYRLVVAPGAVTDLAGNAYAGESNYAFTTAGAAPGGGGDATAPTAVDFFPAPGSTTLPPDWNLGITFSEAVKAGAGTITLETAAGQVVQMFAAASDPGIQFIGSSLVINPAADLQPGTTYQLVVAPDAVLDLAGNAYAGESGFTFTAALVGVAPA